MLEKTRYQEYRDCGRALWTYRAEPGAERGGPPQGPARPPDQRKTLPGCALPALRAAGRGRAWGGAGRGLGRVGGCWPVLTARAPLSRVWARVPVRAFAS